jgi:hypothetical protein
MDNFDLYKLLNFAVNKDVYAQAMSQDEFDIELKRGNMRLFRSRLGLPEGYRTGSVTQAVESTRLNQIDLTPFLTESEITVVAGIAPIPGVSYVLDFYTSTSRSAEIISYQELSNRRKDAQTTPTAVDLAAYIVKGGLKVLPSTTTKVNVIYYREPVPPVFKTTTNETDLTLEYDSAASTELEWNDGCKLDIVHMVLADMGLNISRSEVTQYAEKLIETGK